MVLEFHATFDGQTLRPEEPIDLKPDVRYKITAEPAAKAEEAAGEPYILTRLLEMATDLGVDDFSVHHKEYARGLRKLPPPGD